MGLRDLKLTSSILSAVAEFDRLGRDRFLAEYGFGNARQYLLALNERLYDSKAIVGVAHKYEFPEIGQLTSREFKGGEQGAKRKLEELGFTVVGQERTVAFVPGELYRRREIHSRFGGQQQGGISTPESVPAIFIFSGESGRAYGYQDGFQTDGMYWYSGEGQRGDMPWVRGNRAIRDHLADGKTLHVFKDEGGGWVSYMGEANYAGHHIEDAVDIDEAIRKAIVFELAFEPSSTGKARGEREKPHEETRSPYWKMDLDALRKFASSKSSGSNPKQRRANTYDRCEAVRVFVLRRSNGICEACGSPAPFTSKRGYPYLEPHHIARLADAGPDHPRMVAAICPNCHRRVHSGADGFDFNKKIAERIAELEP